MPPDYVARKAVSLLGSGPTGGVMGAAVAAGRSGVRDFVAVDMGGTSYDVCLVRGAKPEIQTDWNWRYRYYIGLPMVDVQSVGAGGGSIASVRQGALLVGPESAGAQPGPACYGTRRRHARPSPTPTRCSATSPPRASRADACASTSTRRAPPSTATSASRSASTSSRRPGASSASSTPTWPTPCAGCFRPTAPTRGRWRWSPTAATGPSTRGPRRTSSGSGASSCPSRRRRSPRSACSSPTTSIDLQRAYVVPLSQVDVARVGTLMTEMLDEAAKELEPANLGEGHVQTELFAQMCYPGQNFDMSVPVPEGPALGDSGLLDLAGRFHDQHESDRGFSFPNQQPLAAGRAPRREWQHAQARRPGAHRRRRRRRRRRGPAAGPSTSAPTSSTHRSTTAPRSARRHRRGPRAHRGALHRRRARPRQRRPPRRARQLRHHDLR